MNSTLITPAKLSELKHLSNQIDSLEETKTFIGLTFEQDLNLTIYKQELSTLIKSL